jgi:hypothetical protein
VATHVAQHLYATMRVKGKDTSSWAGEMWMTGWRFGCVPPAVAVPDFSAGTIDLQHFNVNDASTTSTTTHFNKTQNWTGDSGLAGVEVTDGDQDAIAEAVYTYWAAIQSKMSADFELQDVRLYAISSSSPYNSATAAPCYYVPSGAEGGGASSTLPPQCSLVTSLRTAAPGRRGRGRFYVGSLSETVTDTHGQTDTGIASTFANAASTLQEDVRAIGSIASTRYYGMVWHRLSDQGAVVRSVDVGNIIDTQRRRRAQEPEIRTTVTLS